MLPRRGASRLLPLGRSQSKNVNVFTSSAGFRQFGSIPVRSNGSIYARIPARAAAPVRVAVGGALFAQGRQHLQPRSTQMLQARHNSSSTTTTTAPVADTASSTFASDALGSQSEILVDGINSIDGSSLLDMPEHIGYLKALGLEYGFGPTSLVQWTLEHIHVYTGLPWWASIVAFAVGVRVVLFPSMVRAMENNEKMQRLNADPRFITAKNTMMDKIRETDPNARMEAQRARAAMKALQKEAGVNMMRSFVPLLQLPIGIGFFRLMHAIAAMPVPGFETGGILWFTNLCYPDPFFILPVASAAMMYKIFNNVIAQQKNTQTAAMSKLFQYILVPVSCVVTLNLSAGMQVYIVATSVMQMLHNWLQNQAWFRRRANLSPLPPPGASPQPPPSPHHGAYQAPRTISTTATTVSSSAGADAGGVNTSNPVTNLKNAYSGAKEKMSAYSARGAATQDRRRSKELDERREVEEREEAEARREEEIARRRQRRRD